MRLNLIDLFKKITWAKNGDLTDFSQTNYEAGWAHLGDDTPTVQDFNYVQQMNDKKDQWLFSQLKSVLDKAGIEATEKNVTALRDAILMLSKGYSQPKNMNAETVNFIDETGHTHEITKANLEQAGLVQLSSEINSDDETKAPTLKVIKKLKSLYDGMRKLLDSYIPNSKKSSRVDSNSADDVATSYAVKTAYDKAMAADNNANGRVSKNGDTINGMLRIASNVPGGFGNGLILMNKAGGQHTSSFVDFYQTDNVPRASMWMRDAGNGATQIEFLNSPEGSDIAREGRQTAFVIAHRGHLWSQAYGWLHDYFAKQGDNNNIWTNINNIWNDLNNNCYKFSDIGHGWYPNHYGGCQTFRFRCQRNSGLLITHLTVAGWGNGGELTLPEAYNGFATAVVSDDGAARYSYGAAVTGNNKVMLYGRGDGSACHVIVIGWGDF